MGISGPAKKFTLLVLFESVPHETAELRTLHLSIWIRTVKFGFSENATKFEKIFIVLLTRASCSVRATAYSVDSIKHTVLLRILLQFFLLVSIKSTVHWKLPRQINFFVLSLLKILFSIFQKNSTFNRKKVRERSNVRYA